MSSSRFTAKPPGPIQVKYKKISFEDLKFDPKDDFFESGQFGDVRRARWKEKIVAVKCFPSADRKGGFSEELAYLSLLQPHEHIVELYGACVSEQPFIVLEFAPLSLEKVLHDQGKKLYRYSVEHMMSWSRQSALALEYIHSQDMVYRDVKPSNVLLFKDGLLLKFCDFGTAKKLEHTLTNAVGTIRYMAPEVIRGRNYTEACDVFSFAIVIWEIITRRRPFIVTGKSQPYFSNMAILYAMANGRRPPMISNIPKALSEMITKCWDNEPQNRPSMAEIREKLERLCMFVDGPRPLTRRLHKRKSRPTDASIFLNTEDSSALLVACRNGDAETVRRLLEIGSLGDNNQVAVLMEASKNGYTGIIALLLNHGIQLNILDENNQSALMIASQHGHEQVVQLLLQRGAEPNLQDNNGLSSLMMASQNGHHGVIQLLLKHGTQLDSQSNNGWTALMYASWNNHIKVVETLLKHGVHVNREYFTQLSSIRHQEVLGMLNKQLDSDQVEQKHLAAVQQAIDKQGTLTHTNVHGVIVGIARSGKDSLMKRLLGERPTGKSPSTGVAEKAIQVRVEKSTSNTVSACVEDSKWIRLALYDDEAIEMMTQLTSKQKRVKPTEVKAIKKDIHAHELNETVAKVVHSKTDILDINPTRAKPESCNTASTKNEDAKKYKPVPKPRRKLPLVHKSPIEIFKEALKTRKLQGLRQHLENHWSIYLSNTGGQMEFQELLPLLVSGPSMFFITFRLDRDLNQCYEIEYEVTVKSSDGPHPKIFKYTSTATPLETILQTLASIDAVGTYDYSSHGQQRKRAALTYKVFIVGTHRDILEANICNKQAVQSKIKEIDQTLFESVKFASYFRHIKFSAMDQMIFAVDNFSTSDYDFQLIRSSVEQLVNTGDFMTTSPSHWLIYSLVLRQLKNQIESYSNCYRIAKDCGISSDNELKEALQFIHTKMGIIRYFPIDKLEKIVILNPQVLFDKVTELIVETFTFEHAGYHSVEDFKKGIFRFSEFDKISRLRNPDPLLTPDRFAKLLEHLRIAAPFYQYCQDTKCKLLKYFFPCALSHTNELQEQSTQPDPNIPPVVVSFERGYRPMGLAGALIKYLITNERGRSGLEWTLLTDEIYREQITFSVEPSCDITLKMFPTHIEVTCLPYFVVSRQYCLIQKTCAEVCKTIKAGIDKVNSDINYINNTEPLFTFYCQSHSCSKFKPHPAKLLSVQNEPEKLKCLKTKEIHKLPSGYEIWKLQELMTLTTTHDNPQIQLTVGTLQPVPVPRPRLPQAINCTQCDSRHHAILLNKLSIHSSKWEVIGSNLGFQQGELENIRYAPLLLASAPRSWLSAMLATWLEWAPNDKRESGQYATLEALKAAVSKAGLGSTAESLTI